MLFMEMYVHHIFLPCIYNNIKKKKIIRDLLQRKNCRTHYSHGVKNVPGIVTRNVCL